MKVLSNLEFKNSTYILNKFEDFPENPVEGTVIFKENGLYIYSTNITSRNLEWLNILDFTRVNSSFKFEQGTENTEWNIVHNLNTQDLFVIVYDSNGNKQIESEIQFQNDDKIKLIFSEPISGKALLFGASVISSPSNVYTKEEIDELLKNVSGGSGNIVLPENGTDGQVLIKDSSTESGLNWSDKIDGKSAYDIAKEDGFEGSEEEWLESLKGTFELARGFNCAIIVPENSTWTNYTKNIIIDSNLPSPITINQSISLDSPFGNTPCICIPYIKNPDTNQWQTVSPFRYSSSADTTFGFIVAIPGDGKIYIETASRLIGATPTSNSGVVAPRNNTTLSNNVTSAEMILIVFAPNTGKVYSEDETIIGAWIDGKPVYRKVCKMAGPTSTGQTTTYDISNLNIDTIVKYDSHWNWPNNNVVQVPYSNVTGFAVTTLVGKASINNTTTLSAWLNANITVLLEYTKTTD